MIPWVSILFLVLGGYLYDEAFLFLFVVTYIVQHRHFPLFMLYAFAYGAAFVYIRRITLHTRGEGWWKRCLYTGVRND